MIKYEYFHDESLACSAREAAVRFMNTLHPSQKIMSINNEPNGAIVVYYNDDKFIVEPIQGKGEQIQSKGEQIRDFIMQKSETIKKDLNHNIHEDD